MAEDWRRKAYYRTRVLIPVDECLDSAFGDCLVCLTGGQLNLVRNLLLYAERRSTFVSEYHEGFYLAPTTEEWDELQELTADLEGNLMDCEQFTQDLQEILDWVRLQSNLLGGTFSADEEAAFPYTDEIADDNLTPAEEDACAIAQLWFEWGYQVITENVLPATRWGFDYLIPALTAFIATAIGGPVAGAGVWAIAEFIQEIMEIGYIGAETNLINWMNTNKQDIVCALWSGLKLGGDASDLWAVAYEAVVEPAEDISAGDKLMLNLFMGSWAGSNAQLAFDEATEWATSNVEVGYCAECEDIFRVYDYEFPPCPQCWTVFDAEHATCVFPGHLGFEGQDGIWHMYECGITELGGATWDFELEVHHKSSLNPVGYRVGTCYFSMSPTVWSAGRQDVTAQINLLSAGSGIWHDVGTTGQKAIPEGWTVFVWFKGFEDEEGIGQNTVDHVRITATPVP